MVDRLRHLAIGTERADIVECFGTLEARHEAARRGAPVGVIDSERNAVDVERRGVAEYQ